MITSPILRLALRRLPVSIVASALLAGCMGVGNPGTPGDTTTTGAGGSGSSGSAGGAGTGGEPFFPDPGTPACDPTLSVKSDGPALLVNDPAVLAGFSMERVLKQLIDRSGPTTVTPLDLLQRLFDTENTVADGAFADVVHCDDPLNGAFKNNPADGCPRAEGALAHSEGLLTPGHPDFFAPIALVNRLDLMTTNLDTCGEYRLVFAKWSGRSDPSNRVFVIFEGSLPNPSPGSIHGCRPLALHWASLEKESDPAKIAAGLEAFYFTGLPGLKPLVDPQSFGLLSSDDDPYGASHGQVRLSQRMQDPWEMREYHFAASIPGNDVGDPRFKPVTVKNNPRGSFFGAASPGPAELFQNTFVGDAVPSLAARELTAIRMATQNQFNTGESALESAAAPDYLATLSAEGEAFSQAIDNRLTLLVEPVTCDPADPLDARAIVGRATTQTCAGCHAPQAFLGPERKIGCGLVWPDSLGGAHIDEKGKLSPALHEVFLPHRAEVMSTYLQACDLPTMMANLQPSPPKDGGPK